MYFRQNLVLGTLDSPPVTCVLHHSYSTDPKRFHYLVHTQNLWNYKHKLSIQLTLPMPVYKQATAFYTMICSFTFINLYSHSWASEMHKVEFMMQGVIQVCRHFHSSHPPVVHRMSTSVRSTNLAWLYPSPVGLYQWFPLILFYHTSISTIIFPSSIT